MICKRRSARRGRNEGSITKRADGRWMARLQVGYDARGRRIRKCYYGRTRQEVQERLAHGLSELANGATPRSDERVTLAGYLQTWLTERVAPSARPSTYRTYEYIVRVHLAPGLGRIALAKLTAQDVQAFLNAKNRSELSPRTVGHIRAVLRAALNEAVRWGYCHPQRVRRCSPASRASSRSGGHVARAGTRGVGRRAR